MRLSKNDFLQIFLYFPWYARNLIKLWGPSHDFQVKEKCISMISQLLCFTFVWKKNSSQPLLASLSCQDFFPAYLQSLNHTSLILQTHVRNFHQTSWSEMALIFLTTGLFLVFWTLSFLMTDGVSAFFLATRQLVNLFIPTRQFFYFYFLPHSNYL